MQRSWLALAVSAALATTTTALPRAAGAQERDAPWAGAPWTQDRAAARAVERAPAVQSAQATLYAARATRAYGSMPLIGNPAVGIRAMVGVPDVPAATIGLFVGIPFDISGARGFWRREATWVSREAEAALDAAVNEARARAREAYLDVALADATVRTAAARVDTAREVLRRVQARFEARAATALDVALSERELGEAEADLAAARREREEAAGRFRAALDLPPSARVAVEPVGAPALPEGITREVAVARAGANRREPATFAAQATRLRLSTDRLRAEAVSPLVLAGEYEMQGYVQSSVGVSAQWALPVVRTAQPERAVAVAQATSFDARRVIAERDVAREAGTAWDVLALRLEELRALEARAVPALERTLALTEDLYESGSVDYFRVLLARRELAGARLRQLAATRDAWRARVALDRAMGAR